LLNYLRVTVLYPVTFITSSDTKQHMFKHRNFTYKIVFHSCPYFRTMSFICTWTLYIFRERETMTVMNGR